MHSHTAAYKFLNEHLPHRYVTLTQKVLKEANIDVTDNVIRNVRGAKPGSLSVLNALLVVAKNNKAAKQSVELATSEE
jgi:hypothetical protein